MTRMLLNTPLLRSTTLALAGLALVGPLLGGCAPLLVGGAVMGTGLVVTDRRTSGTQVEDQGIELKALGRVRDAVGERGHINVTCYNRMALITGEVQSDADREKVEAAVTSIENVRATVNELAVVGASSVTARLNDEVLASKVKATFIDAKDVQANAFKVVGERSNIYLMGRVTEREAARAAELARAVPGVAKVIRVVELVSENELAGKTR